MLPYFNTSGPCVPGEHYMLSPAKRFARILELVDERKYFTVHAGRQTGKTTSARWLVDKYNEEETYSALWVDIQTAREEPDPKKAFRTILIKLDMALDLDVTEEGGLDMAKLMGAWQTFWRKDGHLAAEGFHYREAGPHLMLMAFLQRIVNSSGRVEREYGLGKGALDLMLFFGGKRYAVEVKLRRDTETRAEALEQVAGYLDTSDLEEGWLVLFDLRKMDENKKKITWQERLFTEDAKVEGKLIHIIGT